VKGWLSGGRGDGMGEIIYCKYSNIYGLKEWVKLIGLRSVRQGDMAKWYRLSVYGLKGWAKYIGLRSVRQGDMV